MTTAAYILLIIVSSTLAIFLILGILALVKINQILGDVRKIAQKAEKMADKAEAVGEFFKKTAGPAAVAKLVSNIVESFKGDRHKRKEGEGE
jgi:hypothetical protein